MIPGALVALLMVLVIIGVMNGRNYLHLFAAANGELVAVPGAPARLGEITQDGFGAIAASGEDLAYDTRTDLDLEDVLELDAIIATTEDGNPQILRIWGGDATVDERTLLFIARIAGSDPTPIRLDRDVHLNKLQPSQDTSGTKLNSQLYASASNGAAQAIYLEVIAHIDS